MAAILLENEAGIYKSVLEIIFSHLLGAGGENRTHTMLPLPDFESGASTSSATPAFREQSIPAVQNKARSSQKIARNKKSIDFHLYYRLSHKAKVNTIGD